MTPWRFQGAAFSNRKNVGSFREAAGLFGGRGRRRCWRCRSRGGTGRGRRSSASAGGGSRLCGGSLWLGTRVDPAGMNASTQAFRGFGIDGAKAHETPERRLNVSSRTAKTVVQIEMAERGIEIVAPHQYNNAAAEPDAFRI